MGCKMIETDYEYFQRRAAEERAAAQRTDHPDARRSHLELAERYDEVAAATVAVVSLASRSIRV